MHTEQESDPVRALFSQHAATLVLYARQWLDRSAAEDVVQEVFVRLVQRPPASPPAAGWLYRSVRNQCLTLARGNRRRHNREQAVARDHPDWFEEPAGIQLDACRAVALLQQLPAEKREAVVLRIWAQMGFAEIAEVMQMPVSTVFNHYRSGLKSLREQMEPTWHTNMT